jgi:hypothetical protein
MIFSINGDALENVTSSFTIEVLGEPISLIGVV